MPPNSPFVFRWFLLWLVIGTVLPVATTSAAGKPLAVKSAVFNAARQELTVTTQLASPGGPVRLLHGDGGLLGQASGAQGQLIFTIPKTRLGQVPCSIEARLGEFGARKSVAGAPAECRKTPVCKILQPANGAQLAVNEPFTFKGKATARYPKAKKFTYEWDFGGGVMGNPAGTALADPTLKPTGPAGSTRFVRDNSAYRIRFAATDKFNRRCEAAIEVKVGNPPTDVSGFPAKVAEQPAPLRAGETNGDRGDLAVLPFQEWSMQHTSDMRQQPIGYDSFNHLFNNLLAHVVRKGSVGDDKPKLLGRDDSIGLRYSAASNPLDPVGADSINSTSQNWPINGDGSEPAPFMDPATKLQKTDNWELHPPRDPATLDSGYRSWSQVQAFFGWSGLHNATPGLPAPDEGYYPHGTPPLEGEGRPDYFQWYVDQYALFQTLKMPGVDHGSYMPGKSAPYMDNKPQPFFEFDADKLWFKASTIPITDVDDRGRVNPAPIMRIEAIPTIYVNAAESRNGINPSAATSIVREQTGDQVLAVTDTVLSNSRDFHCRECHANGKIAANPNAGYKPEAHLSSPKGHDPWYFPLRNPEPLAKPKFYDIPGETIYDQEYEASFNYSSLHDFYDGYDFAGSMINGGGSLWDWHKDGAPFTEDSPKNCHGCHFSPLEALYKKESYYWMGAPYDNTNLVYNPDYSMSMHRFHGELQYNDGKTDILRNEKGAYARFDWKGLSQRIPGKDPNPRTLFPIFDTDGKQLPMEQNCLRCHAGHREPLYDDRMATAGVTCYDCHGDMLAMGRAFPKDISKMGSSNNEDYRIAWFEQTDCGSCHGGRGGEAVKKRAFDDTDLAATTRPVDHADPDAVRFAVVPNYRFDYPADIYSWDQSLDGGIGNYIDDYTPLQVDSPLYKYGRDQHGNMACASCHGAAHAIGPNRDPKANQNVTAIQLQGYAGPVTECNVCHTADAFATEDSAGSTLHYPDQDGKPTILAGPHNTHPINDPNWYLNERTGDAAPANQTDGTRKGGWHSVWSGKPGLKGEDQCAACHGDDHKGTRLSKTPVDRVFDFSGFDLKKLKKKAKFKSKIVKVKAGTPIGCDTCHDIETSRLHTPTGPTTAQHTPVIADDPAPQFYVGAPFSYDVQADDTDGGALEFKLSHAPEGMTIDAAGHVSWSHAPADPSESVSFMTEVTDASGLTASRRFAAMAVCPQDKPQWNGPLGTCTTTRFTSAPSLGLNGGETFRHTATTEPQAAKYQLADMPNSDPRPATMTIDDSSGEITWPTDTGTAASASFRILAVDANNLPLAAQDLTLTVCQAPQHWDAGWVTCRNPATP